MSYQAGGILFSKPMDPQTSRDASSVSSHPLKEAPVLHAEKYATFSNRSAPVVPSQQPSAHVTAVRIIQEAGTVRRNLVLWKSSSSRSFFLHVFAKEKSIFAYPSWPHGEPRNERAFRNCIVRYDSTSNF
jgi:hypothetical protein